MISSKVYLLNIDDVKKYKRGFFEEYFPERLKRAEKFVFEKDKLRCLGVAVALGKVLNIHESDLSYGEYGKPYSDKAGVSFSISHSGDYVALAVSDTDIGVDIQKNNREPKDNAYRILTEDEIGYLNGRPQKEFFKIWSLKESLSKAVGKGIHIGFSEIDTTPFLHKLPLLYSSQQYFANVVEIDNYYITICTKNTQSLSFIEKM
ncbi:MAG TPA: hypothetical protein DEW35_05080 [Ruminococcaceae bacterium]|nr:hypothetical protein [Oscillospiraceae bacterium]